MKFKPLRIGCTVTGTIALLAGVALAYVQDATTASILIVYGLFSLIVTYYFVKE